VRMLLERLKPLRGNHDRHGPSPVSSRLLGLRDGDPPMARDNAIMPYRIGRWRPAPRCGPS
jgi:hypothetical protein